MKSLLLLCLLIAIINNLVSSTLINENEQIHQKAKGEIVEVRGCTPNQTKLKDCNRCRCSPSGRWMCTKKLCLSTTERPEIQLRQSSLTGDSSCKPGTRFKKNCNWCMCSNTGLAICTLKGCFVERPRIPIVNNSIVDRESSVERFRRQTQQEPPVYTPEDLKNPNFTCTPNYTFKVDCNTCWCSADGRRPRYCTRIACNNNNNINNSYPTLPPLPPATTEE